MVAGVARALPRAKACWHSNCKGIQPVDVGIFAAMGPAAHSARSINGVGRAVR